MQLWVVFLSKHKAGAELSDIIEREFLERLNSVYGQSAYIVRINPV